MRVKHNNNTITIDQQTYINEKLQLFGLRECKSYSTPADSSNKLLTTVDGDILTDAHKYRAMVGALIYTSISTRPDITHAVNVVSRYMNNPNKQHMTAVTVYFVIYVII